MSSTIADLERQLAECRAERDEALQRETATAEMLQVINSSPSDLAPVFDAMLEKATRLCEAAFGILLTYDGELFHHAALRSIPAAYAEFMRDHPPIYGPENAPGRLALGERLVHVVDVTDSEAYRSGDPNRRAIANLAGARSLVAVPLTKDERLQGAIVVFRQEVRPFTDKQIALLQNFAAQAVIAMENGRLITETREALEQQTVTAEVLQVINSSPGDLEPVFDAILEKAHGLCGAAYGSLHIADGEAFRAVAVRGMPQTFADLIRHPFQPGPNHPVGKLIGGEPFAVVINSPDFDDPIIQSAHKLAGMRTGLFVPLRKDDALLGYIVVSCPEVGPFSDKQIALLQNFAAPAVIAMENARLITETREALEQQTATAEVLQVINSSPGDLAPVFDAILDKAQRVCGVDHAALELYDGERMHAVAVHGASDRFAETLRQGYRASDSPPARALLEGQRFAQIADAAQINHIALRTAAEVDGVRTVLFVPLRRDDAFLGMIASARREVRPFSEKEIALLENFAAQAVIAMENARLITETREALEQQTATAEVLQVINSSPGDLAPVFEAMLDKAIRLCEAVHGHLLTYDGECFHPAAASGEPHYVEWARQVGAVRPAPSAPLGRISRGERIVHIADLREEEVYRTSPAFREQADIRGARSQITVGLLKDNTLLGAMIVYRQEVRPFSDKQIALLENFAVQAVIAMENARLLGELHQRTDEIAEWNRELEARVAEQVEELGRVGRLKRFLAPQLAELIVSQGDEKILESHRREIVVVFCDLRGYTAFTETAEPEEVLDFLRQYHGALGPLVSQFEGTLDQFSGDGIMVFFNDPMPCPDPAERAVKMAMAMREAARELIAAWSRHGCELGFGIGIAQGYATLGQIGFSERSGYTAIGTVCNLAARLCAEAQDGQILVSSRVAGAVGALARLEDLGNVELKGLRRPVAAFNVAEQVSDAPAHP